MGSAPIIAAAQLPARGVDLPSRLAEAREAAEQARARGARLLLFPEGYLPGYELKRPESARAVRVGREALRRWSLELDMILAMGSLGPRGSALSLMDPRQGMTIYRKRFPTLREARLFPPGPGPVIADTSLGRIGLAICADVVQLDTWRDLAGRVDLVLVASAWPSYPSPPRHAPPVLRELGTLPWIDSNAYRERLLPRAARAVGAPVLFANPTGPFQRGGVFQGGSTLYDAQGEVRARAAQRRALIHGALPPTSPPGPPLTHELAWGLFMRAHAAAAKARGALRDPGDAVVS